MESVGSRELAVRGLEKSTLSACFRFGYPSLLDLLIPWVCFLGHLDKPKRAPPFIRIHLLYFFVRVLCFLLKSNASLPPLPGAVRCLSSCLSD